MNAPAPPARPSKEWSTLKIVLVVVGSMLLVIGSTCGVSAYRGYSAFKEVSENLSEGGLAISASPEVIAELHGAKKDYLGRWTSTSGKSTLEILDNGHLVYHLREGSKPQDVTAPITKFSGNDIECHFAVKLRFNVKTPPHLIGNKLEMQIDNVTFERPASPAPAGS